MANAQIKITQLPNIDLNDLGSNTILPVVNTTGTAITEKVTVGNVANFILNEAGNLLPIAGVAEIAYSVANAAQPNITSVGNLTGLTVTNLNNFHLPGGTNGYVLQTNGNGNLNWTAQGGEGNGNPGGANSQIQFNNSGLFAGSASLTWDSANVQLNTVNLGASGATIYGNLATVNATVTTNLTAANANFTSTVSNTISATGNITANFFLGNGSALTGITATANGAGPNNSIQYNANGIFAGDADLTWDPSTNILTANNITATANISANKASVTGNVSANIVIGNYLYGDGSNISNIVANTANYANYANFVTVESVNNNFSYHIVLTTGPGDSSLHSDEDDNFQYNPVDGTMTVTRVDAQFVQAGNVISNLIPFSNITYNLGSNTHRWKDIWLSNSTIHLGDSTLSANGNSVIVSGLTITDGNIGNIGNIASINLDGSNSNVLYGNGVFAPAGGGGGNVSELVNGLNSFVLDNDGNVVFEGNGAGQGINRGVVWDYGANANGVNSELRQDNFGITVRAYTENGGGSNGYSAAVNIVTNQGPATNTWSFDGQGNLTLPGNINAINDGGQLGAQVLLQPDLGKARLAARTLEYTQNFNSGSWTSASYTLTQVDIIGDPNLLNFVSNNTIFTSAVDRTFSINGGDPVPYQGYGASGNNVTLYTSITADPDPTVVTSIDFYYQSESYFGIDYDDGGLDMIAAGLTINIDNDQTQGPDINLRSGDDITLQAKNKSLGSESEGGDINIYAGDGASDDGQGNTASTGGDIQIEAGQGGDGNSSSGAGGGFTTLRAGTGGYAGATNPAGSGGYVEIRGGNGGGDGGNTELGAGGGYVSITAGSSTQEGVNGAAVTISSGSAGPNALAGNVEIFTPASGNGPGGTWRFDGNGNLTLPSNSFAVNYANGTPVPIGGGGGNTGNVTFDNVTVQGVNGLNLSAGSDFTANLAYLQVRAGDVASHIHLDTGNNSAYDLIVGDDQNYVQVSSTGNILLSSYDSNTAQYTWTLDYNGNLILAGGNSVIQSIANSSLDPLNPNVSTMVLTPDPGYYPQSLVLDPTAPGHIHLRAYAFSNIDDPAANIFLGGEATSFEITYGSNNEARVHSNNYTWTFGNDGTLLLPRDASGNTDPYLWITGGNTPSISSVDVSLAGPANFQIVSDYLNLSGYSGAKVAIKADNGEIATDANMVLSTNNANVASIYSWTFGTDGTLTLPGNLVAVSASPAPVISGFSSVSALQFTNGNSNVTINANSNIWTFDSTGNLKLPGNTFAVNYANGSQASAPLVDVLNTNGLTTVFYPTFVENRTDGQIVRADVDLSYRTDTNTLTAGNVTVSGNLTVGGTLVNSVYLLEAYASETYTLPGSFTEDICRYSYISSNVNVSSSWFDTSTYTFTPQKAGYWEITAAYDVYRNTEATMIIKKNTTAVASAGSFNAVAQQVTKIIYLNGSTDYIQIFNSGGAALSRSQYAERSWFQARWIGV